MTTLHDRLADLAGDVPVGPAEPGLWDTALRLHRRRRVGTAAFLGLCFLLVAGICLGDWRTSRPAVPVGSGEPALGIPDRIEEPSRWLDGTGGEPFGPLAAVAQAARGSWTGETDAWVGISAATGEYRFLDLPEAASGEVALSPDGRLAAYWITGPTPGSPGSPNRPGGSVIGYAVYDMLAADTVLRRDVGADHGLMPERVVWIDVDHLALSYSRLRPYDERLGTTGFSNASEVVDLRTGRSQVLAADDVGGGGAGWVVEWGTPTLLHPLGETREVARIHSKSGVPPVVDPTGRRVAGLLAVTRGGYTRYTPAELSIARVVPGGSADLKPVPGRTRYLGIVGWRDPRTVLAYRHVDRADDWITIYAVDIRTGISKPLVRMAVEARLPQGLLDLPVVDRPAPPRPWDPRALAGLIASSVLACGTGAVLWRRRVRP